MVDDHPKINLYETLEQLIEKEEKSGSNIIPTLHLYVEKSTRNIVKERAPEALPLLEKLIEKLRNEFYNPNSNSELKPYGQPFASNILSSIRKYVETYIHPESSEREWKIRKLRGGLKYLLEDNVLNDVYETVIAILKGKFEDPYESTEEKYKRYYRYLHRDDYILNVSYLSFDEQLSMIREQQAREYIRRGIIALMHAPGLGILTKKNKLECLLSGYSC